MEDEAHYWLYDKDFYWFARGCGVNDDYARWFANWYRGMKMPAHTGALECARTLRLIRMEKKYPKRRHRKTPYQMKRFVLRNRRAFTRALAKQVQDNRKKENG